MYVNCNEEAGSFKIIFFSVQDNPSNVPIDIQEDHAMINYKTMTLMATFYMKPGLNTEVNYLPKFFIRGMRLVLMTAEGQVPDKMFSSKMYILRLPSN